MEKLNKEEYKYLKNYNWNAQKVEPQEQTELLKIYNKYFNKNQQMTNCTSCWVTIIFELKLLFDYSTKELEIVSTKKIK